MIYIFHVIVLGEGGIRKESMKVHISRIINSTCRIKRNSEIYSLANLLGTYFTSYFLDSKTSTSKDFTKNVRNFLVNCEKYSLLFIIFYSIYWCFFSCICWWSIRFWPCCIRMAGNLWWRLLLRDLFPRLIPYQI